MFFILYFNFVNNNSNNHHIKRTNKIVIYARRTQACKGSIPEKLAT